MPQVLTPDRFGALSVLSSTMLQMALSPNADIRVTIAGQQYSSQSVLQINTLGSGAGGIDTGFLAPNTAYFVYFIVNGTSLALVASTSNISPTGFSLSVLAGFFSTDNSSVVIKPVTKGLLNPDTITVFTSGSGNYYLPNGCIELNIELVGGGGGGGGSGTAAQGTGFNGTNTIFGVMTANGGGGGSGAPVGNGGAGPGGSASLGAGPQGIALTGATGAANTFVSTAIFISGCMGGNSPFGGAGAQGAGNAAGFNAVVNTGSGGGGAGTQNVSGSSNGCGGGAGGYIKARIKNPGAVFAFNVGIGGGGGAAGTNGIIGGNGADGIIIIEESYS